jgi:undecaprenyl phosphate-alpha-L-ara4N flippase subunit ArnE
MKQKKQEKTSISSMLFIAVAALFASAGQVFYKFAANRTADVITFIANPFVYLGLFSYGVGLIFMLKAIRRGELTVIYPIMATSFIWVSLASPIFFKTDFMTLQKWIGIFVIIAGVTLLERGRKK